MAEDSVQQWETDKSGHKSIYEGFGATTITVLGWILVTLITMLFLFTMESGFFGTFLVLIVTSVVNLWASSGLKKMLL